MSAPRNDSPGPSIVAELLRISPSVFDGHIASLFFSPPFFSVKMFIMNSGNCFVVGILVSMSFQFPSHFSSIVCKPIAANIADASVPTFAL
jgi:hypothetical protein